MKTIAVLSCLVAVALARPQQHEAPHAAPRELAASREATILRYENENIGIDGYKFAFDTSDGISREEQGTLKNAGSENEIMEVHGSYKYKDPFSGLEYLVTFVADENGFRPQTSLQG